MRPFLTDAEIKEAHQQGMKRQPIADWATREAVRWVLNEVRRSPRDTGENIATKVEMLAQIEGRW